VSGQNGIFPITIYRDATTFKQFFAKNTKHCLKASIARAIKPEWIDKNL
jgi:hypothetical protein